MITQNSSILRLSTCGSVDDGKSTLIGRLLYDTKSVNDDRYAALDKTRIHRGDSEINLALLADGLKAEREQGITIDVSYQYFHTRNRKYIIADTPGHWQYTRNMVTGASNSNVALILIDVRKGMTDQTRRHAIISSLLQIPHLIICLNKMDLVNYEEAIYQKIRNEFSSFASKLDVKDIHFIPISALKGDNIVLRSENMKWYEGSALLYYLENLHISSDQNLIDFRLPIQNVIRPNDTQFQDFRSYAGKLSGGTIRVGDSVEALPSGIKTTIKEIFNPSGSTDEAFTPQSISITLNDDIDLSRGDVLVKPKNKPESKQDFDIMICWFDSSKPLQLSSRYIVRHTTQEVKCIITEIIYKMDITTLHRDLENKEVQMNDIAKISIKTTQPLLVDEYKKNKTMGSMILVDEFSNSTVAACMVI